jgi:hypothetical protein
MKQLLVSLVLLFISGCTPRQVAFVADSMGYVDKAVIEAEIEANDHNVVRYHTVPGATTWSHPDLTAELFASDVDTIVVTFGLNETRYLRGDADAQPQRTLAQVLASWNTVKTQAAQQRQVSGVGEHPNRYPAEHLSDELLHRPTEYMDRQ